ncbi:MAG: phenylacetic acid degradation protein [Sneathiella sp.]|uniref:1,2-phenylacetyl-CoA epoxidase subunit PaaE n=1 Tax=Sneathiella sp. TaxID=1964365 RepID=UPI000C4095BA|nr:1,2-phenylacetyl-CoA epoxidase subunit PaaE [Sneathiella sp.]MAZ02880.1 phenylacetic acid degradation protein [Sneathiella sp.]
MTVFHSLKIKDVVRETKDAVSISFEVPEALKDAYRFTQGQHLTLKEMLDGEEVRRSYSICSAVGDPELRVAIKRLDGGKFSSHANQNLKPGAMIEVMEPQGRFFTPLDANNRKHYLAVAAGSGITPILSIIKTILKTEPFSRVTLIYGNRRVSGILFLEALEDLKNIFPDRFNLMHILSREHQDAAIFNGRISAAKCEELAAGAIDITTVDDAFLCGPEQMIMDVRDFLLRKGLKSDHIHFELFITDAAIAVGNRPAPIADSGPKRHVKVILGGRKTDIEVAEDGVSILDRALQEGLDLPYACKGGVCSTCRAKVLQGKVEMDINYALEDDEVAEGYVLTCQSHPLTDDVIVDFDV